MLGKEKSWEITREKVEEGEKERVQKDKVYEMKRLKKKSKNREDRVLEMEKDSHKGKN